MNNEEKNDIKEFNKLRDSLNDLWAELEDNELLEGENRKDFVEALSSATDFVKGISGYFDDLERKQKILDSDFKDKRDKTTKEIIKIKKELLDSMAERIDDLYEHPTLRNLFLEVTLRCNARCEHCGSSCGDKIPKDEISAEELKKALDDINEHYGASNVFLTITGGEPLMRKDLFDILKYARSLGYSWGMATNAMLITEQTIEKIKETEMFSVSISLDGLKETHENFRKVPGSFEKVMKAIDMLKEVPSLEHLQITTVANKKNLNELEDIYQLLLDKGIKEWRVMNVDPIGRANLSDGVLLDREGLIYMLNFIKEKRREGKMVVDFSCSHYLGLKYEGILRPLVFNCGAGLYIGSILSNGDICVCPNARNKKLIQGNIKTDSFVDVWDNKFEIFRKKRITTNEKCKNCKSFKYCRGDSFHTWNYEENVPNMCMKEFLGKEFVE
jgi:radical SAM protein with 4Fe4S-binding SPASM domain